MSILTWISLYLISITFRYCYVHRLPLYYVALNEIISTLDYYIEFPIDILTLLMIHLILIALLIFGYSYYYIKYKLNGKIYI